MKHLFSILFIILISIAFGKKVKIGICIDDISTDRWAVEIKSIENTIRAKGGEVIVKTALGKIDHEKELVEELINTNKIDVLLLVPVDKFKSSSTVHLAHRHGVKVILYSREVNGAQPDATISFDPVDIGKKQAKYVSQKFPNSNVVLLGGPSSDINSELVENGQLSIFDSSTVNVISNSHVGKWSNQSAYDSIASIYNQNPNLNVVIAGNDLLATGVIEYFKSINKQDIKVIGLDAELQACQRIANKTQEMTIYLDIKKSSYCAALVAMQLGQRNNNHAEDIKGISLSRKNNSRFYKIESTIVSSENLEQITEQLHLYTKQQIFGQ